MEQRTCHKCLQAQSIEAFSFKKKITGVRHLTCKTCMKAYNEQHYLRNKFDYIERARQSHIDNRVWYRNVKIGLKCSKCSESHPACLDFHHRDPSSKKFSIGSSNRYTQRSDDRRDGKM